LLNESLIQHWPCVAHHNTWVQKWSDMKSKQKKCSDRIWWISCRYNKSVDYWSLGILTYELLTGQTPFDGDDEKDLFESILKNSIDFPSTIFTKTCKDLLENLLKRNPNERLTSIELIRTHLWFEQNSYSFEQLQQQSISAVYIPTNLIDYSNSPLKSIEVISKKNSIDQKLFEHF